MKCSICEGDIEQHAHWDEGNNARPVNEGRCCDSCDCRVVMPTRMGMNPHSKEGLKFGNAMYRIRISQEDAYEVKQEDEETKEDLK